MTLSVRTSGIGAPSYTESFLSKPVSVRRARRLVAAACHTWRLPQLVDSAQLVAGELVANAVGHASGHAIRLTVTHTAPGRVRVAVVDKDRTKPRPLTVGPDDEHGRGLAIIAACSAEWGVDGLPWGKRVWADLDGAQ